MAPVYRIPRAPASGARTRVVLFRTPSSATTYTKSGSSESAFTASGADQFTAAETGAGVSVFTGSGADQFTATETGAGVSALTASGARQVTAAETGAGISPAVAFGADATTFVRSNIAVSPAVASGADATTFVRANTAESALSSSGPSVHAVNYDKTGSATTAAVASGRSFHPRIQINAGTAQATQSASVLPTAFPNFEANAILVVVAISNGASTLDIQGSGWSALSVQSNVNLSTGIWWKRASTDINATYGELTPSSILTPDMILYPYGDGAVTSSAAGSASNVLYTCGFAITGCVESGTPFEDATLSGPTLSTTPTGSTITTTDINRMAVTFALIDDDNTYTVAPPPATWDLVTDQSTALGGDARITVISKIQETADDVAGVSVGTMDASDYWRTLSVAFIQRVLVQESSGAGVSALSASGASVYVPSTSYQRSGSGISALTASAPDQVTFERAGAGVSALTTSSSDAPELVRANTAESTFSLTGGEIKTLNRAGSGVSAASSSGVDVTAYARAGLAAAPAVASGPFVSTSAPTYSVAGTAAVDAVASGYKNLNDGNYLRTGLAAQDGVASGGDETTYTRAGLSAIGTSMFEFDITEPRNRRPNRATRGTTRRGTTTTAGGLS